jgi:hypothetical protein
MNISNEPLTVLDIISIINFLVGIQNLEENRVQSQQNDVNVANDKQAKFILDKLEKRFDEQNKRLERIEVLLNENR